MNECFKFSTKEMDSQWRIKWIKYRYDCIYSVWNAYYDFFGNMYVIVAIGDISGKKEALLNFLSLLQGKYELDCGSFDDSIPDS